MHKFLGIKRPSPALHRAVQTGEISNLRLLLQKCPQIDEVNEEDQRTALHAAAATGYDVILGELLDRRAKAGLQDKDGNTPLHLAAAGGHTRCVQLLLSSRNADQNKQLPLQVRNAAGLTPLAAAAAAGHAAVADLILRVNPDMHSSVLPGRVTVGHLAARGGHVRVLAVLASHGFDLASDTLDMNTLLHDAARHGNLAAVSWLLQAGLNPRARNAEQKQALDLARAEQHHAVVQVLRAAVATSDASSSGASTPTASAAGAAGQMQQAPVHSWQQQGQQGLQPGQLPVYPDDERYKFYPMVDKRPVS